MTGKQKSYWHTPPSRGACCFAHLGYVLFKSDDEEGRVLVSHVADPAIRGGEPFWKLLKLSTTDIATLRAALAEGHTCWLVSDLGVGFISARYDLWSGYFLYIHIHDDPSAVRRLLYRRQVSSAVIQPPPLGGMRTTSAPSEKDEAVLRRLEQSLAYIDGVQVMSHKQVPDGRLSITEISTWISSVASFIGCSLGWRVGDASTLEGNASVGDEVSCPSPRLVEGMILYWICLFHRLFPEEEMICTVSPCACHGETVLRAALHVVASEKKMTQKLLDTEGLFSDMNHMIYKGELCGVRITATADDVPAKAGEPQKCLTAELCFFQNPARNPPSGLKNPPLFSYDDLGNAN